MNLEEDNLLPKKLWEDLSPDDLARLEYYVDHHAGYAHWRIAANLAGLGTAARIEKLNELYLSWVQKNNGANI